MTGLGEKLVKSSQASLRPLVMMMGELYTMWGNLSLYVRRGQSSLVQMSKTLSPPVNGDVIDTPAAIYGTKSKLLEFLKSMHMLSSQEAPHVVQELDFSDFVTACDLGGGTGAMAAALAKHHQHLQMTVFDLPCVISLSPHFIVDKPPNLNFKSGDFFRDSLPVADLYILSHILHGLSEEKMDILLERIYTALPKGGSVMVLEKCLHEEKTSPTETIFFDLGMMVCSQGKERSGKEYRAVLRKHGFSKFHFKFLPSSLYCDIMLAKKD